MGSFWIVAAAKLLNLIQPPELNFSYWLVTIFPISRTFMMSERPVLGFN